jgi:hypothetical protein
MRTPTAKSPPALPARNRLAADLLLLLMVLGSPVLWIGIPLGAMWVASKLAENVEQHGSLAILISIAGMLLFAFVLAWLNGLYLRFTTGADSPSRPPRYAWNRSMRDEPYRAGARKPGDPPWRVRGPLEPILAWSFAIALVALIVWFFVLAEDPPYVTFGGGSY